MVFVLYGGFLFMSTKINILIFHLIKGAKADYHTKLWAVLTKNYIRASKARVS
jgi:hypothetical protein